MRMRKKKNLEQKLALCTNLFDPVPNSEDHRTAVLKKEYLDLKAIFGNDNPVELEIGCGKGQFVCEKARLNPGVNYLAVEINRNVISMACRKALDEGLTNVFFIHCGAEILEKYLPDASVSRIYLNFSCPFPKKAYENKRLTYYRFLEVYSHLMKPGAEIHQKTDNMHFFEFSIEQFSLMGYRIKNVSLDLHGSGFEGNIITEYETRFTSLGMPIYRLEAYLPVNTNDERTV